jgi:hypothetical protein
MIDSDWTNYFLSAAEFFALAKARLSLNTPEALTDPHVIPRDNDQDADPAVSVAIGAMRPIRTAAVLSGSKAADMAAVAPVLFPEMKHAPSASP